MTHAAHPVTTEVPLRYDGSTSWLKYSDAVEEWCDLTRVEARRHGPAIADRLSGWAELFKERDLTVTVLRIRRLVLNTTWQP